MPRRLQADHRRGRAPLGWSSGRDTRGTTSCVKPQLFENAIATRQPRDIPGVAENAATERIQTAQRNAVSARNAKEAAKAREKEEKDKAKAEAKATKQAEKEAKAAAKQAEKDAKAAAKGTPRPPRRRQAATKQAAAAGRRRPTARRGGVLRRRRRRQQRHQKKQTAVRLPRPRFEPTTPSTSPRSPSARAPRGEVRQGREEADDPRVPGVGDSRSDGEDGARARHQSGRRANTTRRGDVVMDARDDEHAETRAPPREDAERAGRRLSNGVVTVGDGVIVEYFFAGVFEPCVRTGGRTTPIGQGCRWVDRIERIDGSRPEMEPARRGARDTRLAGCA